MTRRLDHTGRRRWNAVAAAMVAALGALVAETIVGMGPGGAATVGHFADDIVVVLAAVLCLLRALDEPRGRRAPWLLFAGALAAW